MKQLTRKLQSELSNWHSQDYTVKKHGLALLQLLNSGFILWAYMVFRLAR